MKQAIAQPERPKERPNRLSDTRTDLRPCGCDGSGFRFFRLLDEKGQRYEDWTEECCCRRLANLARRVGRKFAGCTLDSYDPRNPTQARALETLSADPLGSYFIFGDYGSGKTHLLAALYRHVALRFDSARYHRAVDLKDRMITEIMDENRRGGFSLVADITAHQVRRVFIDDLDKLKFSEFLREQFFALFDAIDKEDAAVSITANEPLKDLESIIGGREGKAIGARIERLCKIIEVRL